MLDIVLLGGQSNAVGFSPWSNGLKNYDNVLYFGDGVGIESSENSIEKLPTLEWTTVKNGLGRDESKIGPEFGMANVLTKHYETLDRDIGIVKYAWGGKTIYDYFLSPTSVSQYLGAASSAKQYVDDTDEAYCCVGFWNTLKTFRTAVAKAKQNGYTTVNIVGMCWMQGENDVITNGSPAIYDKLLANFITDMRNYLEIPTLPFAIGLAQAPTENMPEIADELAIVQAAQRKVADNDNYAMLVDTSDLTRIPTDHWHYDTTSMLQLGQRFAQAIILSNTK